MYHWLFWLRAKCISQKSPYNFRSAKFYMRLRFSYYILRNIALFTFIPVKIYCFKGLWIKDNQYLNILLYFNKMLTILVRVKILTDALASVASVWIRACGMSTCRIWADIRRVIQPINTYLYIYRVAQKKVHAFDLVQRKNYKCYIAEINVAVFIKV
jgi:hypothetical protein